ncbi:MAG: hypothetical protein H0W95_08915 [Nocardioidaceae bacterium]|nr:hypothetical protein [Nocardioidaceae bacterium]
MARHRLGLAAVIVAVMTVCTLLVGGSGGAAVGESERGQLPRIRGNVGPGFSISVRPREVAPGSYRFVIQDQSTMHNWHIRGNGVDRKTGVAFTGTKRFTLDLTEGRYRIQCDMHPTTMVTRLRVVA